MRALRNSLLTLTVVAVLALLGLLAWSALRGRPQDLPWTPLDLAQPVDMFTGRKLTGLTDDFGQCRALLDRAGVRYTVLPVRRSGDTCGYADGVRFLDGGARRIVIAPTGLGIACPVAAALARAAAIASAPAPMDLPVTTVLYGDGVQLAVDIRVGS